MTVVKCVSTCSHSHLVESRAPTWRQSTSFTYEGDPVGRGRQDFDQNKLHESDGEQHGDLEANLSALSLWDYEGSQVQAQQEQEGQQDVDDVEERMPLHGDLWNDVQASRDWQYST